MNYLELLMTLIFMGIFFLGSVQPMMMVIFLMAITLWYSLFVYKIMGGYWFGYALVMVMLSGVLVVFTYMVSLIPNESFEVYNLIMIIVFMMFYLSKEYFFYGVDFSFISLNLWNSYVGLFNLFLVSFLLSMMIMVVWLSCWEQGAVRVSYMMCLNKGLIW